MPAHDQLCYRESGRNRFGGRKPLKRFFRGLLCGIVLTVLVAGIGLYGFFGSVGQNDVQTKIFAPALSPEAHPSLEALSARFERSFREVMPRIYLASGYGLANVIVIDAPDGLIMVDTLEGIEAAEGLLPEIRALRKKTGKDVTDIIYTHNHGDHVFGSGVFTSDQQTPVRIWAYENTANRVHDVVGVLRPILFLRSMRQFGSFLSEEDLVNAGIGPFLLVNENSRVYFKEPTQIIEEEAVHLQVAGENLVIRKAEGETPDQLMLYLSDRDVLLPADNYYHAFPNLYAIRGTPYRDVLAWVDSIDEMIGLNASAMIPQHSQPVFGAAAVKAQLTDYRDAIQFVHDQTVRGINKGLMPNEIAGGLKLPPHLAAAPYLQEFYGRVDWASRAIFSGYLGWFSGDPKDLLPLSSEREAALMIELAGGKEQLKQRIAEAMQRGEPQWALVLASHLRASGDADAAEMQALALIALGEREISATGRNYFLTSAAEARGFVIPQPKTWLTPQESLVGIPIRSYLELLQVSLKAEEVLDIEVAYCFNFSEPAEQYTMRIRRGVAVLQSGLAADCIGTLNAPTATFKAIAAKAINPAMALASGALTIEGGVTRFVKFMGNFEKRR